MPNMQTLQVKKVYLNGTIKQLGMDTMSYDEICQLVGYHPAQQPTIQFTRGPDNASGVVSRGQRVALVSGMSIDCVLTGAA